MGGHDGPKYALVRHGTPEIFNTDQGSQFTSEVFTGLLKSHGIAISTDGKGCWHDNVFIERVWKSVKYEELYLYAYDSVSHARQSLGRYVEFYDAWRPHSSLDRQTPNEVYFQPGPISATVPHLELVQKLGQYRHLLTLAVAEGFGLVQLEAMAMGTIVVGFDVFGGRQYMRSNSICLIAKYPDIEGVAKQWIASVNQGSGSERMAEGGQSSAAEFT